MKTYIIGPCSLENYELSYEVLSTIYPYIKDKDFYFNDDYLNIFIHKMLI